MDIFYQYPEILKLVFLSRFYVEPSFSDYEVKATYSYLHTYINSSLLIYFEKTADEFIVTRIKKYDKEILMKINNKTKKNGNLKICIKNAEVQKILLK